MQIDLYQIDAFTGQVFGGNPAAVCPLDAWIDDDLMQKIAGENNLSETALLVQAAQEGRSARLSAFGEARGALLQIPWR